MAFLLGILLLVSGDVLPDSADSAPPAAQAPAQQATAGVDTSKGEKKICRREESTESRLGGKRICLTAEQWKRAAQGAR
jgi:hypothetical protein